MATLPPTDATDSRGGFSSSLRLLVALIALLPIVAVVGYIAWKGVNVPRWDQWVSSVDLSVATASGHLTMADLFKQNFAPRLFLTNVITALLTATVHWNILVELYISFVIVCANFALLLAMIRRDQRPVLLLAAIPFAAITFGLRQYSNWLWSMQTSWFLMIFFFLLALWVLQRSRVGWKAFTLAAICTIGSTFSMFHGLALWVLMPVVLWMFGYRRPKYLLAWVLIAAVIVALYFSNYDFVAMAVESSDKSQPFFLNPIGIVSWVLAVLGNPFAVTENSFGPLSRVVAVIGLALIAVDLLYLVWRERRWSAVAVWAGLAGFSVAAAVMSAAGRAQKMDIAPWLPLYDRYVTPSTLLWLAFFALALLVIWHIRQREARTVWEQALVVVHVGAFIVLASLYAYGTYWSVQQPRLISEMNEDCVIHFPETRNAACMTGLWLNYMSLDRILEQIDELAAHRLTTFAAHPPPYTDVIQLRRQSRRIVNGDKTASGFRFDQITDTLKSIVFAEPAPGQVEFNVTLPQTDQTINFYSAASVDPTRGASGEVVFRVGVRDLQGKPHLLSETRFVPLPNQVKAIQASLSAFNGQAIQLILQVAPAQSGEQIAARWIDPVIFVMAPTAS